MSMQTGIGVLIAEDHHLVRAALAALLRGEHDIHVAGEAADGLEAVEKAAQLHPRVVLMDISMPRLDGIEATARIVQSPHPPRVLVLSQYDHEEYIRRVVQAGASGYILKNGSAEDLKNAIRAVARGEQFFAPSVSKVMVDSFLRLASGQPQERVKSALTNRETEILRLIVDGSTNQQIAQKLSISVRTVEFHRGNILEKTGVKDTAGLVKYAIQRKLVVLEALEQ
ncbi:MAG: response regulator transcription factor [Bacteroidota bacterium]